MKTQENSYQPEYRGRVNAERSILMMPMNVVMSARIKGDITAAELQEALAALRTRHALLAVRINFDDKNIGWYTTDNVPEVPVQEISTDDPEAWKQAVRDEWRKPFLFETGPLARTVLVRSGDSCELIVTAHHVICDGTSLTYLIRDILTQLDASDDVEVLPPPPPITSETVPAPKKANFLMKLILGLMNKKWKAQDISFDQADMVRMLDKFWQQNPESCLLRWELSKEQTDELVRKCRAEKVTINSALWAAFIIAQQQIQGDSPAYRSRAGMAVSTRDKLKVPVGDALGFYASSLSLDLPCKTGVDFWQQARLVHKAIHKELAKTDIFRALITEELHPTMLDSLYFAKYDGLDNRMAGSMLKKMSWDKVSYGYSITNVGRVDIATEYGSRRLEAVYGPMLYSDVNEKVVGITTVGGCLTFSFSCNAMVVSQETAEQIKSKVSDILKSEV